MDHITDSFNQYFVYFVGPICFYIKLVYRVVLCCIACILLYTVSHKKEPTCFFPVTSSKSNRLQFLLLDLTMNDACDGMNSTHVT